MRNLDYYVALGYKVINKMLDIGELRHHGIKGQKWGVRNGPPYPLNKETKKKAYGKDGLPMKLQFFSKGAKSYRIYDKETKDYFDLMDGTHIWNKEVFRGKGCKTPIKDYKKAYLTRKYGGEEENWQKVKGVGDIDYYGESRRAKIHWYQEEKAGDHEYKVKEWLE
jgi:hypothetical protein